MIQILFFAGIRETLGTSREKLELPAGVATVAALRDHLVARGGAWAALGEHRNLRVAVNQAMVGLDSAVADGDEVAFFPPVTGG
ncbi:molybdopterin converting factor subunit 1 [Denitratisoma sp. DHT3]|uniref:molybdopterin converting factor subunit 1 n=1 Tax=Denitratisoma sp. DHT3 TaxID=1981880 RepID=UPI0011986E37|nr:molybdopterin converting factor subunit 1 [Denitratisoma sp. DHT3]QDX81025.1 molybdopterin converting factor subunit 1 [Denitratisoma sp. DHT3]